jgi:predicted HTH transcriptional regulator
VAVQYGSLIGELSITHAEYRRAKDKKLPVLAFIKGERSLKRETGTDALLKELDADGPKYKRFGNVIDLQKEVRAALVKQLKDGHGIVPSSDENEIAQQTIEATSTFESQPLDRIRWVDLDHSVARRLVAAAENKSPDDLSAADLLAGAKLRGLIWQEPDSGEHYATAAGIVILRGTLRRSFRSVAFWPTPIAARRQMATRAITKTFAGRCPLPSIARLRSSTATPDTP